MPDADALDNAACCTYRLVHYLLRPLLRTLGVFEDKKFQNSLFCWKDSLDLPYPIVWKRVRVSGLS